MFLDHKMNVKMAKFPKFIYRFNSPCLSLSKPTRSLFVEIDKLILKFIWNYNGHRIAQTTLKKKKKLENSFFLISKFTTKLW